MDYELFGYQPGDLVRMDILVKGDRIDALSIICDRRDAEIRGRAVIKKLKQEIPRHMFEVPLQAAIGSADHRPRDDLRDAEERDRQVLRRRHQPQAQAVGEAEGRQEADEVDRPGRHPAEGVPGGAGDGRRGREEEVAASARSSRILNARCVSLSRLPRFVFDRGRRIPPFSRGWLLMIGSCTALTASVVCRGGGLFFLLLRGLAASFLLGGEANGLIGAFQQDAVPRWDLDVAGRGSESAGGGV